MIFRAFGLICALVALPASGAPLLEHPVDCTLGQDCYIQNYVDVDPSENWSDFACGRLSYDGHKGTDFALHTLADMRRGVDVLSAAPGRVSGTRDGMKDMLITKDPPPEIRGKECGNGVAVDHGDGWITQYCHMKQGSIAVAKGDFVEAGTKLGQVGLSGKTQFPHLHMSLRHNGQVVDPFAPKGTNGFCDTHLENALWADNPGYVPGGLLRIGFNDKMPLFDEVKTGEAGAYPITAEAQALVLFAQGFGSQKGDEVSFTITGPEGFNVSHVAVLEKTQAHYFRAAGKRRPHDGWAPGSYLGKVSLIRNGKTVSYMEQSLQID